MTDPRLPAIVEPDHFGQYRVVRRLPMGGMGRVYYALDTANGDRPVALKLIDNGSDIDSREIVEAERRGAALQCELAARDPRVVRVYETGDFSSFFYIAMEYIEGNDIAEVLERGPMDSTGAISAAVALLEVLHTAHTVQLTIGDITYQGIVHGDIKPRNVRLTPVGGVRVLDFGIAKALTMTREYTRNQFGSTLYSSPERLKTGEVDVASDLWAVAVVLFEMVAGRPYFTERNAGRLELEIRNYRRVLPMPEAFPPALKAVLARALDPDEPHRYISALAFHDDLRAIEEGLPTNAEMGDLETERTRRTSQVERDFSHDAPTVPTAAGGGEKDEDQATRRTVTPVAAAAVKAPAPAPAAPQRKPPPPATLPAWASAHWWLLVRIALLIGAVLLIWHEYRIYAEGSDLSRDLAAERIKDINEAWEKYQGLADRNLVPLVLHSPRKQLEERFVADADRVLADFRDNDTPGVTIGDWKRAQAGLAHALELSPDDNVLRGKLRVIEGHILRIGATGRAGVSSKGMNDARMKFEEARELWKKAPDPYLGLARVYIYGMKDVDRGEEALREAEKRGHPAGRREKAQLADGYRERADQFAREAAQSRTTPEAMDYLNRAVNDYQHAETMYQSIVPFSGASAGARRAQEAREKAEQRRQQLLQETAKPNATTWQDLLRLWRKVQPAKVAPQASGAASRTRGSASWL